MDAPTGTLLQQCRIQPAGPKRAAPLVALALRMDDRDAAELIATSEINELILSGSVDEASANETGADGAGASGLLVVDGTAALEAVRVK